MNKLKPTIAILTATLALAGCGQQYQTIGECKLAELKNLDQPDENAAEIVADYCAGYFAKIYKEETEESNRSVQLVTEPEWEEVWKSTETSAVIWVDINSIAQGPKLVRAVNVFKAESEEKRKQGVAEFETWIFNCSQRLWSVRESIKINKNTTSIGTTYSPSNVIPGTNIAEVYNFVCSYESPRNDPYLFFY